MTQTYYKLLYHVVWSTKERAPIITKDIQDRLYAYMGGLFRSLKCHCIQIGGMPDHVHALISAPPSTNLSDVMRQTKTRSSSWVTKNYPEHKYFSWQNGYGAFSVSPSNQGAVIKYIQNQESHHKQHDFKEEFIELVRKHGVDYDEKYFWQ